MHHNVQCDSIPETLKGPHTLTLSSSNKGCVLVHNNCDRVEAHNYNVMSGSEFVKEIVECGLKDSDKTEQNIANLRSFISCKNKTVL